MLGTSSEPATCVSLASTPRAITAIAIPMGTFTRNSHGQEAIARIAPPIVGPAAIPTAMMSALIPIARPSWLRGKIERISAGEIDMIDPAPIPCSIRAATSSGSWCASAHNSEPTVKIATP